jgi:hypothetical protein
MAALALHPFFFEKTQKNLRFISLNNAKEFALHPFNNVIFYHQITGKNTEKRFVSLFASYHQEDSVLHDINYLHSHGSMLPTILLLYLVIQHQRSLVLIHSC